MKRKIFLMVGCLLFLFASTLLFAGGNVVSNTKALVNDAATYLSKTKDLNAFNDPKNSRFVKAPLYVFVYECKSDSEIYLKAHPFIPKLVGRNIAKLKDKMGKYFVIELCKKVKSNPNGAWIDYYWINPKTQSIEKKFTYIKQAKGTPYQVAVGFYESEAPQGTSVDKLK